MKMSCRLWLMALLFCLLLTAMPAWASSEVAESSQISLAFLEIAVILLLARVISGFMERIGQPAVLGELLLGIILGNLGLLGWHFLDSIRGDASINFLKELGVVVLLFQVGLESKVSEMVKVGIRSTLVATIGVVLPFILGTWVVGPWILPGLSFNTYLFLGAALTATSVGITARVFQELGKIGLKEAQIVIGAAVIDDVIGLIVLAVVSGIVSVGNVGLAGIVWITVKAGLFLLVAIVIGQLVAKKASAWFAKIHDGFGMKFTVAMAFCLIFAFLAQKVGLAPIVGAFAAGLVLDPVHFTRFRRPDITQRIDDCLDNANSCNGYDEEFRRKLAKLTNQHAEEHVEWLVRPLGFFLTPIFFVMTGVGVRLETLFNPAIILAAVVITIVAFVGKIASGVAAGKGVNKLVVGVGMIARGEVGLIFVLKGQELGVVPPEVYAVIICVIVISTLFTPIGLNYLLKRQ